MPLALNRDDVMIRVDGDIVEIIFPGWLEPKRIPLKCSSWRPMHAEACHLASSGPRPRTVALPRDEEVERAGRNPRVGPLRG